MERVLGEGEGPGGGRGSRKRERVLVGEPVLGEPCWGGLWEKQTGPGCNAPE